MTVSTSDIALLRNALRDNADLAQRDLRRVWREFNLSDAAAVRDGLMDVLPGLIGTYRLQASVVAADWYDLMRLESQVSKSFEAVVPDDGTVDRGRVQSLAGWSVGPLFGESPDAARALTMAAGGLQRLATNGARRTVMGSSLADPAARGWQRTGTGECAFCAMLIGRGAVYSESTVNFGGHDNCNCAAVPAWGGQSPPVKPFAPTNRDITDADRARVRAWISTNA